MHDEQTNFQNITEISFLPSSIRYFIVTADCLLLGTHVFIVMGALQIDIDDDDDRDDDTRSMTWLILSKLNSAGKYANKQTQRHSTYIVP